MGKEINAQFLALEEERGQEKEREKLAPRKEKEKGVRSLLERGQEPLIFPLTPYIHSIYFLYDYKDSKMGE